MTREAVECVEELEEQPKGEEAAIELQRLAARASTLDELWASFAARHRPVESRHHDDRAGHQRATRDLAPWVKACAGGDQDFFQRRLAWDSWTKAEMEACLAEPSGVSPSTGTLAKALETLRGCFAEMEGVAEELSAGQRLKEESYFPPGKALPFLEILVPFLRYARHELAGASATSSTHLSAMAQQALEVRLLHDLVGLAVDSLYERFQLYRQVFLRGASTSGGVTPGAGSTKGQGRTLYLAFVDGFLRQGGLEFFERHATLSRHLARIVDTWVACTAELVQRFQRDRSELVSFFGAATSSVSSPAVIEAVGTGLSDRHGGGRQVLSLRLTGGLRLIYKPRSMVLEKAYNGLLRWLAEAGLDSAPRSLKVLARDGYGWVETVDPQPVENEEAARAYFRRSGALVCLAYALRGDDLHGGNVVACAEGPAVVDGETFLQPSRKVDHGDAWDRSALRSQLLTNPQRGADGGAYDHGGLQSTGDFLTEVGRPFWSHTNTDAMAFEMRDVAATPGANELRLGDRLCRPEAYGDQLLQGFRDTYRFLVKQRRQLLAPDGPLEAFRGGTTRILFRPSQVYGVLLSRLSKPRYQGNAVTADFLIDSLNRAFLSSRQKPRLWPLVTQERRELQGRDVPHFSLPADSAEIPYSVNDSSLLAMTARLEEESEGNGGKGQLAISGEFLRSGFEAVLAHMRSMSEDDLEVQSTKIGQALEKSSLAPTMAATEGSTGRASQPRGRPATQAGGVPSSDFLVNQAVVLADLFLRAAEAEEREVLSARGDHSRDGGLDRGFGWMKRTDRRDQPLASDLYGGSLGLTIFLAATARVTARDDLGDLARRAAEGLVRSLPSERELTRGGEAPRNLGLLSGLGGWLYALPLVGDFLGDPVPWTDRAREIARTIRLEDLSLAMDYDLSDGLAGTLVGLLALEARTRDPMLLQMAESCAERLLQGQTAPGSGMKSTTGAGAAAGWPDRKGNLGVGFGHGAAGVVIGLARLARRTENTALRETLMASIQGGLDYERSLFSKKLGNWPVVGTRRQDGRPLYMVAWCNGAAGIGLGRLELWKLLQDSASLKESKAAVATVGRAAPAGVDHLCCGNLGRLELLLEAGRAWGDSGLEQVALQALGQGLGRVVREGGFRLDGAASGGITSEDDTLARTAKNQLHPGFFRGLSGVGYSLLRFADPQAFPSILSFEAPAEKVG